MQSIIRSMLIAFGILVIITVAVQVFGSLISNVIPLPTATPYPTNLPATQGPATLSPGLVVHDQKLTSGNTIIVDSATARVPGWVSIHTNVSNNPGSDILGYAPLPKGISANVHVTLTNTKNLTSRLWAVLHVDTGQPGVFDYPGADGLIYTVRKLYVRTQFQLNK